MQTFEKYLSPYKDIGDSRFQQDSIPKPIEEGNIPFTKVSILQEKIGFLLPNLKD